MKRFLVIPFFFILLQGCIPTCLRAPFYQLNQTDLCQNVQSACVSPSFREGDFALCPNWWDFFKDPQLKHFIELSLACHPDIAVAESRIRKACCHANVQKSALYPHVYLYSDVQRNRVSELSSPVPGVFGTFTQGQVKLTTASYELDLWKKNRALYYAALDEVAVQKADYEEVKLLLSTSIAAIYFDLQMNLRRIQVNKERLQARKELYDLLKQQFNSGVIAEFRLYETDTEVEEIQDLILQIEAQVETDKHALAALVGNLGCECLDFDFVPCADFEKFPLPCSLAFDLLVRRPDIKTHLWRIEADKFYVHVAKTRFYPRIDLLAYAGFLSYFSIEKLFTNKSIVALGEATGVLPLFTAGQLRAELCMAQEDLEIAVQRYNRAVLDAVKEASDALSDLIYADKRLQSVQKSLRDTEQLYSLTNQRFHNGIANRIAVLNAEEDLFIQKDLEQQILLSRYVSAVDLIRAIGGGYYDPRCCICSN